MPDGPGDEHDQRYRQLREQVVQLHREAAALDAALPDDVPPGAGGGDTTRVPDLDEVLADGGVLAAGADPEGGHDEGADAEEGQERLSRTVARLTEATDAMLAFGDRLPVLRDLPARAWSVQIVRAAALAVLLGAVLVGLGIWRHVLVPWWAPVALAMLPAAARTAVLPVAPAAGRHRRQRWLAGVTGAAALLVAPVTAVFGWAEGLACTVVFGVAASALLELRGRRA